MNLKCIGGRCDGQKVWIDYKPIIGDAVRVVEPLNFTIEDFAYFPNKSAEICEKLTTSQFIYIIDCLKYSHKKDDISEIWFLRSENLTTFDAIQFQFMK